MYSKTPEEFHNIFLNKISFLPYKSENGIIYRNEKKTELGYLKKYSRNKYYDFRIGDYTIPKDFSINFDHKEELIRFGTVYEGKTLFEIENSSVSSFTPSSFFVVEKNIKGRQVWHKDSHLHGAEITIYKSYFDEVLKPVFPEVLDLEKFTANYTYHYLPLPISSIINKLRSMAEADVLTSLYLESKILECIALIHNEINSEVSNAFTNQIDYGEIKIGKDRKIALTYSDVKALQSAYDILTAEAFNPPTISNLSKRVFLNEQKLKAGFKLKYHMSINEYTTSIRMSAAENLLSTTELSIDEIAKTVGYNHSSNFINMFKKVHKKTPLSFKKQK